MATINGKRLRDVLIGTHDQDWLYGFAGNDVLFGGSSEDVLDGGTGADTMYGGWGHDMYYVDSSDDIIVEVKNAESDSVHATCSYRLPKNVEALQLVEGSIATNAFGNELDNHISTNERNNYIDGGLGADGMAGNYGNDTYVVDNAHDIVAEIPNAGIDTVLTTVSYADDHIFFGGNIENITLLGTANINATGNALNNRLIGNSGNNDLNGLEGTDIMIGGRGNDDYGYSEGDVIIEHASEGFDTVHSSVAYTLGANLECLRLEGMRFVTGRGNALSNLMFTSIKGGELLGAEGNDTLHGGAGMDVLSGGQGNDTLYGWAGNDSLSGDEGDDLLFGGDGQDHLHGKFGSDTLCGGLGDDIYEVHETTHIIIEVAAAGKDMVRSWVSWTLTEYVEYLYLYGTADVDGIGNNENNDIIGNSGDNILDGKIGTDALRGDGGLDHFVVHNDDKPDEIIDFTQGEDVLRFSAKEFAGLGEIEAGVNLFNVRSIDTPVSSSGPCWVFVTSPITTVQQLYFDGDGSGTNSGLVMIAKMYQTQILTAADFERIA